jgi:hypothetical protein
LLLGEASRNARSHAEQRFVLVPIRIRFGQGVSDVSAESQGW